ncbi:MAG: damage-inducible protein J [Idiomarina sp. 34-48-12]|nr:MAG: damage-inducible protein J [Idiomarina sp. 34-48-12]
MDTRIQFRVDEETKRLAQLRAESQGRTLSDACRELTEKLALEQRLVDEQDQWLTEQIQLAFAKVDSGQARFFSHDEASTRMRAFKKQLKQQD